MGSNNTERDCPIEKCSWKGRSDKVSEHLLSHQSLTLRVHIHQGSEHMSLLPNCKKSEEFCEENNGKIVVIKTNQ